MRAFKASGSFKMDKKDWQRFSIEMAAEDEDDVIHRVYSILGSRHRLKRRDINIQEVSELDSEDIVDQVVEYLTEEI